MQKYIFVSLIILANIIGGYLLAEKDNKPVYPEETASKIANDVNNELNTFLNSVYIEIDNIKNEFNSKNRFSQQNLDNYFILNSDFNKSLYSIFIKKNNLFYIVNSEKNSLKSAFDTLESVNVVKWNRYKNKKLLTSWTEVVQLDSVAVKWLDISNKFEDDVINWGVGEGKNKEGVNVLLSIIRWNVDGDNYLLIFRYLQDAMNVFDKNIKGYNSKTLLFNTINNDYIKVDKDTIFNINHNTLNEKNFVFEKTIIDYSKTLEGKHDSIFSFTYNEKLFWTINLELDHKYGIKDFTLTIPNEDIATNNSNILILSVIYFIFLIISIITILYLLKIIKLKHKKVNFDSEDVLLTILKNDEGRYLEFKSSLRWDYRQEKVNTDLENVILKTIAAFGNSDGGTLLIGVDDDKNIIGLDKDYSSLKKYGADFFEIYLRNILHKHMGVKYITENIRISFHKFDDKEICKIEIFKASEPLYLTINKKGNISEKFYVRSGNSSNELSSLKDINDYIFNRFKK